MGLADGFQLLVVIGQPLLQGEPLLIELAEDFATECGQLRLFLLQRRG
jgi:hypothetical protein